jgi:threonine synthase
VKTISPSIDIQVPYNFERVLFYLQVYSNVPPKKTVNGLMKTFEESGHITLEPAHLQLLREWTLSASVTVEQTKESILEYSQRWNRLLDPHTAVGVWAADHALEPTNTCPVIVLGTADAAKFPEVIQQVTGKLPQITKQIEGIERKQERKIPLPSNKQTSEELLRQEIKKHFFK